MSDERIDIEVQDKVAPGIRDKILGIAAAADKADTGVEKLKKALAGLNDGALSKLNQAVNANATAILRNVQAQNKMQAAANASALSQQKLATEQQKTAAASMQAEAALNKAVIAEQKMLAVSANTAASQTKLATAQQQLATASAQTAAAVTNAAAAQTRATTAQTQGATAAQRLSTAQAQTATAQQRSATEAQRTATAAAQAAAAQDRAALAALRLKQAQEQAERSSKGLSASLAGLARQALALAGTYYGAGAVLSAADAYTTMQNKLQNVTTSAAQLANVQQQLFEIANRTRSPVAETTSAFQRFDMAMQQLGAGQAETLRMTETINKAIIVSGATSQEAAAGMLQLAQAFGSGRLQGDEFRSIMENLPAVADMLAKSLGVTRGELKKMSTDGKLTAEVMRKAFADAAADMDAKFGKTVPTMGQSVTVLKNNWMQFVGEMDKATGVTRAISAGIMLVADNIGRLTTYAVTAAAIFGGAYVYGLVAAAVATGGLSGALTFLRGALIRTGIGAIVVLVGELIYQFLKLSGEVGGVSAAFQILAGTGKAALDWIIAGGMAMIDAFVGITFAIGAAFTSLWASVQRGFAALMVALQAGVNSLIKGLNDAFTFQIKNPFTDELLVDMKGLGIGMANFADGYVKAANETGNAADDLSRRSNAAFDRMGTRFQGLETPIAAFNRLKSAAVEAKKATDAATAGQGALRAPGNPVSTPASSDDAAAKSAEKRASALAKVNRELDAEIKNMGLIKPEREIASRMSQIENELANKKIVLSQTERAELEQKIRKIQELKEVQTQLDAIYDQMIQPMTTYNATLAAANALMAQGVINANQYGEALRNARIKLLESQNTVASGLELGFQKIAQDVNKVSDTIANTMTGAFSKVEDALVKFVTTGKLDFKELANSILADIARMIVKLLILRPLMNGLGGMFGLPGFSTGGSMQVPGFATGGNFMVGGSQVGDKNLVAFRANGGERVSVETKAQQRRNDGRVVAGNVNVNVYTQDAQSFVQSEGQVAAAAARAVQRGYRNL